MPFDNFGADSSGDLGDSRDPMDFKNAYERNNKHCELEKTVRIKFCRGKKSILFRIILPDFIPLNGQVLSVMFNVLNSSKTNTAPKNLI